MPNAAAQEFILFRTDQTGLDLLSAATQVQASADVDLVRRNPSALLVQGPPASVEALTSTWQGWSFEPNTRVRGGV